jgi:PEP-CTERM motif
MTMKTKLFRCLLLLSSWLALLNQEATAQGTFEGLNPVVVQTLPGQTTSTISDSVFIPISAENPMLYFNFGFATDEVPAGSQFLDSLSITLQDVNQTGTALFLTVDANGLIWAPVTPGTIPMDPNSIVRSSVAFPSLTPVLANQQAWSVIAPIPPEFEGKTVNLFVDMFNNQNALSSLGWISQLQITPVPEPSTLSIGLVSVGFFFIFRRKRA